MPLSLVNQIEGDQLDLIEKPQLKSPDRVTGYLVDVIEMETLRNVLTDKAFVYVALQIDVAEGRIKQLNQQYDELAVDDFCDRWDFKPANFYSAIDALYKNKAIGVKYRQLTLDLITPEADE